MKTYILFLSFAVLLTFVRGRTYYPGTPQGLDDEDMQDMRILFLLDPQEQLLLLNNSQPEIQRVQVDDEEVSFHYMSRQVHSFQLSLSSVELIFNTDFDPNRRTMFIVHGWNNDRDSTVNQLLSKALLTAENWNVFVVDWGKKANGLYTIALGSIPDVGEIVASFIDRLMAMTGMKIDKVNMAGHSLGAHVCGRTGNVLNGQIETIVGMDAALPFISLKDIDGRLDPTDAKYVQAIHTSGGFLGILRPIGDSDFYPNGGQSQNGCGLDPVATCAHSRAYEYFAESILNNQFKAIFCESKSDWQKGRCDGNVVAYMGGNNLDRIRGKFYLDTNKYSPFARN